MTIEIEQEPDRVPRGLVRSGAAVTIGMIVASVGATLLLGWGGLHQALRIESRPPALLDRDLFAGTTRAERLKRLAEQHLRSYGWVNRAAGIVHVPIDVAIESYLEEKQR
jgi:hypothetical protein